MNNITSTSIKGTKQIPIQMPKKEKVLDISIHDKDIKTVGLPLETKEALDKLKVIPEEPYYKVIGRLIENFKNSSD